MATLTRQDVQNVVEQARGRLFDHVASRQDMQTLQGTIRTLTAIVQQNQHILRQEEGQSAQLVRRSAALESRMTQLENELQYIRRALVQLTDHQPTARITERAILTGLSRHPRYLYTPAG